MKNALIFLFTLGFLSCNQPTKQADPLTSSTELKTPKNIILLIGDGMGLSQVSAGQFYSKEASNFDRFPTIGLIKTSSSSHLITDSAAGATAYASGIKTYNKSIGMNPDSTAVANIVEQVSKQGIATGLIATSSITHATPAAFYAHTKTRYQYEDIATFLPNSEIDFFAGGGLQFFNQRKDKRNLLDELTANGFHIDTTSLSSSPTASKQGFLLAANAMKKMNEGRGDFLPTATNQGITHLNKNEKGFFLMVESSQIDWGGHDNDGDYLITEQLDFDNTIGKVLDFAELNGETLVIVTADHETGGFTLASNRDDYNNITASFSTDGHSATMIPVFAKGPGAENFGGIYENTEIYHKMIQLLNNK